MRYLFLLATFVASSVFAQAQERIYTAKEAKQRLMTMLDSRKARYDISDPPSKKEMEACMQSWGPQFRDPKASYVVSGTQQMRSRGGPVKTRTIERTLIVEIRTPNGYGGMEPTTIYCDFDAKGRLDPGMSQIYGAFKQYSTPMREIAIKTGEEDAPIDTMKFGWDFICKHDKERCKERPKGM